MQAGKLDTRITVMRNEETGTDWSGHPITELVELATVWAHRHDVSDTEKYAAGGISAVLLSRFTVRSTETTRDIRHTDFIVHDDAEWNIDGIKQAQAGRHRMLEITAKTAGR